MVHLHDFYVYPSNREPEELHICYQIYSIFFFNLSEVTETDFVKTLILTISH